MHPRTHWVVAFLLSSLLFLPYEYKGVQGELFLSCFFLLSLFVFVFSTFQQILTSQERFYRFGVYFHFFLFSFL